MLPLRRHDVGSKVAPHAGIELDWARAVVVVRFRVRKALVQRRKVVEEAVLARRNSRIASDDREDIAHHFCLTSGPHIGLLKVSKVCIGEFRGRQRCPRLSQPLIYLPNVIWSWSVTVIRILIIMRVYTGVNKALLKGGIVWSRLPGLRRGLTRCARRIGSTACSRLT